MYYHTRIKDTRYSIRYDDYNDLVKDCRYFGIQPPKEKKYKEAKSGVGNKDK